MERSPTVSPICAAQAVIGAGGFGPNRTDRCGECQYGFLCGEFA